MTHTEALEKAAKLLRLATSSNPHEAALAASRAQEIMDRFKLSADAVNGAGGEIKSDEPIRDFRAEPLESGRIDRWRAQLAIAIAEVNQAQVYRASVGLALIGRASDVQSVRYLYAWLVREVETIAARNCSGFSRTYWNNFRVGAVETIANRLREQAKNTLTAVQLEAQAEGGERALALVQKSALAMVQQAAAVEAWAETNLKLRSHGSYRTTYNETARQAGRRAGATVRMGGSHGSLGSGRFALR